MDECAMTLQVDESYSKLWQFGNLAIHSYAFVLLAMFAIWDSAAKCQLLEPPSACWLVGNAAMVVLCGSSLNGFVSLPQHSDCFVAAVSH